MSEAERKSAFSRASFRTALICGIAVGAVSAVVIFFLVDIPASTLTLFALIMSVLSGTIVYGVTYRYYHQRIKTLDDISKRIARKTFGNYGSINLSKKDEIDSLIIHSIRASKTVEKEFQRLNKIENYRKEFIGDISHELKTPIFAIQGFIETLLDGAIDDEEVNRSFLRKAMRNVNRLTYLTKDLMEISRLETGELKTQIQNIQLRDLIVEVVESLHYKSEEENVTVFVDDFDQYLKVRGDKNQIKQVLINLIENGIKYNYAGGFLKIGVKPNRQDSDRIWVYVADTGIGIDKKDIPRVTERFFRVDKSRSRERGGTGLGLSIVKHILEAHGEKLSIESNEKGTTFRFTLTKANDVFV